MSRFAAILVLTLALTFAAACGGSHLGTGVQPTAVPGSTSTCTGVQPTALPASTSTCPVTVPHYDRPPHDPNPFFPGFDCGTWYINADRTIWASAGSQFERGWDKVLWIRPAGTQLIVTGQRLDAPAPPLRADIPSGYPSTFQASGLTFPTPGCWQVTAKAGTATLQFVVTAGPY